MTNAPDQPARGAGDRPAGAVGTPSASTAPADTTPADTSPADTAAARGYVPRQGRAYDAGYREARPSGAALGFTVLAAVLMMVDGSIGFVQGLAAIIRGSFFARPNDAYVISVTGWGWIHLALGVLIAAAGVALLLRDMLWARITGVVLASFSVLANFMFIPYYPLWSFAVIALDLFVIWALLTPRRDYA
jgi:hypothetical protein